MNERIKELAKQAEIKFESHPQHQGVDTAVIIPTDLEKFAKLIIAKCIEEAGEPGDGLIKGDTWHDGVRASVWSIEEYFGVEE